MKRAIYDIHWGSGGHWWFVHEGKILHRDRKKIYAQWRAQQELKRAWEMVGLRSELVIHGRDGRIQDRRTYGGDPKRTKG